MVMIITPLIFSSFSKPRSSYFKIVCIVQYIFTTGFASSGSVQNFGLAAAASMVLGIVLLLLTLIQLYLSRSKENKHQEI